MAEISWEIIVFISSNPIIHFVSYTLNRLMCIGVVDVKMDASAHLGLILSSKLDWGSYISSIAKTARKKIESLIPFLKFLFSEVALYLYKSTIWPCLECCYVWAGVPSCYFDIFDKLQKQIYRTWGPSLAAFLEPLTCRWNGARLSLFCRYYFGRCSSELFILKVSEENQKIFNI